MGVLLRAVRVLLVLLLAGLLVLAGVTAFRIVTFAGQDERRASDAIVVLGAAQFDGRPGPYLEPRLQHAADLYAGGIAPVVITAGGSQPGDRFTEAEAGRNWLAEHDVPADSVVAVGRGDDTLGSALATGELMRERGWRSAVVVTDPWHSLRATEMLQHAGIDAVASPTRTGPSNDGAWSAVRYTARETVAYLYWWWQRVIT